ncbi:hypothetical protein ABB02_00797 [Clostridiaceae bacterium JG1575]|nr:hypothetical protein ABB02_00797 [Clostridiaceae bacterium JG1575]
MKKVLKPGFWFLVVGLAIGVYYRELTRWTAFTGTTILSVTHGHAILLGFVLPLLVAMGFEVQKRSLPSPKLWMIYYVGVVLDLLMMLTRGTVQVLQMTLSRGLDASISGFAGLSHGLLGISLCVMVYQLAFKKAHENPS